jgi:lysophospholipase L1-like esterase
MKTLNLIAAGAIALSSIHTPAVADSFWTSSWMAAPEPLWQGDFLLPTNVPFQLNHETVRQVARVSLGGTQLRIELSNEFGSQPLRIGAARVARHLDGSALEAGSERRLRFGGRAEVVIAPGARVVSDAVELAVPALGRIAVSLYLPQPSAPSTFHWDAHQTGYIVAGDQTAAPQLPAAATRISTRIFLSGVLVDTPKPPVTVVALGDSLTDGNGSTPDADRRWPDFLAARLAPRGVAVLNAGNSGGRLLKPGMGPSALARAQRDVFGHAGVQAMVVMLGTNDIGWPGGPFAPDEKPMSADEMIQGLQQLIAQARARNVRIIGGTIAPNENALQGTPLEGHHSAEKDGVRRAVNTWIRESGAFDGVVDFDALLRDPVRPSRLNPAFDSGDHLHPSDEGMKAMAELIDLEGLLGRR